MSGLGDAGVGEVNAEAGAEHRLLDVMRGQRVTGEEFVDVAAAYELAEGGAAASVDDCGTAHDERFALLVAAVADEVAGDFLDEGAFGLLGGNAAGHKREVAANFGPFNGDDSDAGVAGDDRHPFADFGHRDAARGECH